MWYRQLSILCILLSVAPHNLAKPFASLWDHIRVKHTWNNFPPNWESLGPPPAGTTINLDIVLIPQHENALNDALYEVSDPSSLKYGAHLSKQNVAQLVAPHQDTLELVNSWLENHDIPPSSISMAHGGSWLTLTGVPVSRAYELLSDDPVHGGSGVSDPDNFLQQWRKSESDPITPRPAKGDVFLEWLKFVIDKPKVPQTITISYSILETYIPQEYGRTICNKFAELGARGASVLIASGNNGVGPGNCLDVPEDSSPFVTTVGGTTGMYPEIAAGFSGGGFSSIFPRPPYQGAAVTTYLQRLGSQYNSLYKASGRAIPEISPQASDYSFIRNNIPYYVSGTSCAVPTVAIIMISLLNDYRLSTGRTPLGFLNPWLYVHGRKGITKGITDITSGSNPGYGTPGFPAIVG